MKLKLRFLIRIPMFIILIGLFAISASPFNRVKAIGYWKFTTREIHYVEPFLPEKVTYPADLPWNKIFKKVVNGGEMSTLYAGQEYNVTRQYMCKHWAIPSQQRIFTWSRMPDAIRPGQTYNIGVSVSGNGFGSADISRLVNTKGPIMWLSTGIGSKVSLQITGDLPQNSQNPEMRMIYLKLGSGSSGTDTFNYAAYVYIYKWING